MTERREWTEEELDAVWDEVARPHKNMNTAICIALLDARADADAARQQRDEARRCSSELALAVSDDTLLIAVLKAECRAWRCWYDGCQPDGDNMIWAGGDEWGHMQNARAATDALLAGRDGMKVLTKEQVAATEAVDEQLSVRAACDMLGETFKVYDGNRECMADALLAIRQLRDSHEALRSDNEALRVELERVKQECDSLKCPSYLHEKMATEALRVRVAALEAALRACGRMGSANGSTTAVRRHVNHVLQGGDSSDLRVLLVEAAQSGFKAGRDYEAMGTLEAMQHPQDDAERIADRILEVHRTDVSSHREQGGVSACVECKADPPRNVRYCGFCGLPVCLACGEAHMDRAHPEDDK